VAVPELTFYTSFTELQVGNPQTLFDGVTDSDDVCFSAGNGVSILIYLLKY